MTTENQGGIPPETIGDRMHRALRHAGISVSGMADYLGVHRNTVSTWLNDHVEPDKRTLMLFSQATGVTVEWLETGEDSSSCSHRRPPSGGLRSLPVERAA